jgi:hypothetical protein
MKAFADLYTALDETTKTNEKLAALVAYFSSASAADAAWVVYFLSGRKPKQAVNSTRLRTWAGEVAQIPEWLFLESYDAVGDIGETITLLLPDYGVSNDLPLSYWVEQRLLALRGTSEAEQRDAIIQAWYELDRPQRFVWNKLITGAFRVAGAGDSQRRGRRDYRASSDGCVGANPGVLHAVDRAGNRWLGRWPPLSVLPRLSYRGYACRSGRH